MVTPFNLKGQSLAKHDAVKRFVTHFSTKLFPHMKFLITNEKGDATFRIK